MAKDEILKLAMEASEAMDPYSLESTQDKLGRLIRKNMDETAEALDREFFPFLAVLPIAECTRDATEYTGISSLAKALSRWSEKHPEETEVRAYAEEALRAAESVPF